ncbi:NUDIX domain-containing protein [Candidatus Woesearchaeota archaeon]|nr:NUDIX domain-containing protein [Candidatus Woesearchaeota archaeon]
MQQKVAVSGFIFRDGKALILRRGKEEHFLPGYWELPGGKLEFGEDPHDGVLREVKEEACIDCEVVTIYDCWHYMMLYHDKETQFIELTFILNMKKDKPVIPGDGMDDYRWVTLEELDRYQIGKEMKEQIQKGFQWMNSKTKIMK